MNSTLARRLISLVIALLLLSYIGYQIYQANYSQVRTETAVFASLGDSAQTEGVVIRKETLLTKNTDGVVAYEVEDGGRMSKGGTVASVYPSAQAAAAEQQVQLLREELNELTQMNKSSGNVQLVNPESLTQQIHMDLYELLESNSEGSRNGVQEKKQDVLSRINQWQIVTGKAENFDARIQALNSQITALSGSSSAKTGAITAPAAGYFIANVDGYESAYSYENVRSLSVADLKKEVQPSDVPANVVGKMCENFDWYLACIVPAETAEKLKEGNLITVDMPFATTSSIPARIVSVNQEDKESEAAVILRCNYMDSALANIRKETIRLNINTYEGVRVSQRAVRFVTMTKTFPDEEGAETEVTREVRGVYVLHGSEIKFVEIIPVFSSNNYVICKVNLNEQEKQDLMTDSTISLYDEVVVGGSDLYDGKIVK